MGKEIIVDEMVRDAFIFENQTPAVGLLIGTYNETGEYCVAHLAQTFAEVKAGDGADNSHQNGSGDLRLQGTSLTEIQLATVSHHTKQVIRMLPGGLVVLGLYVVEPVENIFTTKYEGILKSILTVMNKSLSRNVHYGVDYGKGSEKLVIHYHPTTKKFTVKAVDSQTFKTKQMETSFIRLEWAKLECEYDTFFAMHLAKADVGVPLKRNMKVLIDTFQETLASAKFIINGKLPSKDIVYEEPVPKVLEPGMSDAEDDVQGENSASTGSGSGSSSPRHHGSESGNDSESENLQSRPFSPLHILIDKAPGLINVATTPGQDFVSHLHLHGKIAVVAFVRVGCSTAFMVEMVKQDILRSLSSRIEMHCESLIEEEQGTQTQIDEGTTKVYHEVPRRVFANLLGSKLLVSDYLFPGEGPKDSVVSFRDILSVRLDDETDIIMTKEKPFNLDELRSKGSLEELICKVDPLVSKNMRRNSGMGLVVMITFIIVMLSMLIPYFMRETTSSEENLN